MNQLWLKYKGPNGDEQRIAVDKERYAIGRHSASDLTIADSRLSREHALIERVEGSFVLSDRGSSNGTSVNGERLFEPRTINSGDVIDLGGLEIEAELEPENTDSSEAGTAPESGSEAPPSAAEPPKTPAPAPPAAAAASDGGFPTIFFIIAPIFGFLILALIGLVIYVSSRGTSEPTGNFVYSNESVDPPVNRKGRNSNSSPAGNTVSNEIVTSSPGPSNTDDPVNSTPPVGNQTDSGKTEQNAAAFLRRAAQNDTKDFITGQQAQLVNAKIKTLSGSSALSDNINSARKSAAQIKTLAASKNLKPQFLAVAAITKLGSSRGDVLQTAQSVADVLAKLGTQIGSELGDDCLLMMAAYDQGAAGDFMKMRNMLQDVAAKTPESSRSIRTIWFLKKNGKISDAEFDMALRFLAIGTVTQNPKDYGVNAEALVF